MSSETAVALLAVAVTIIFGGLGVIAWFWSLVNRLTGRIGSLEKKIAVLTVRLEHSQKTVQELLEFIKDKKVIL